MKTKLLFLMLALSMTACSTIQAQSNLPRSKEATFRETYNVSQVAIIAKGIGNDVSEAEKDAKKAAVYFVLYSGGNVGPVLRDAKEKKAFEAQQEEFFKQENVEKYVPFMGNDIISRIKQGDGTIKVEKLIRVEKQQLINDLASKGILTTRDEAEKAAGRPVIMVLPTVAKGEDPLQAVSDDANLRQAASVIESFLTARLYDVEVPEQKDFLKELKDMKLQLGGAEEDLSYKLAMSIGSDVYINYSVDIQNMAANTNKAMVTCRAYETTTAKLLGTETGYSPARPNVPDGALIEEAMNSAIEKVLANIDAYLKKDLSRGQQYKIIFTIKGSFSDADKLGDAVDDALKEITNERKEITSTGKTIDFTVWQNKYDGTRSFFRDLETKLKENEDFQSQKAKLKRIQNNRKLLLLSIEK